LHFFRLHNHLNWFPLSCVWLRTVEPDRLNSVLRFKCLDLFVNNLRANHTKSTLKWSSFFCCLSLSTRNLNNNPLLRAVSKTLNAFIFSVLCSAPTSSDKGYLRYHSSCLFINLFSYSHWYQNRIRWALVHSIKLMKPGVSLRYDFCLSYVFGSVSQIFYCWFCP